MIPPVTTAAVMPPATTKSRTAATTTTTSTSSSTASSTTSSTTPSTQASLSYGDARSFGVPHMPAVPTAFLGTEEERKAERKRVRTKATLITKELDATKTSTDADDVAYAIYKGEEVYTELLHVRNIAPETENSKHEETLHKAIFMAKRRLERLEGATDNGHVAAAHRGPPAPVSQSTSTRLRPLPAVPAFGTGDVSWRHFWGLYRIAIHDQSDIGVAEKLVHLLSLLRGEAAAAVAGFEVEEGNYDVILDTLRKRFDKVDARREELTAKLLTTPELKSNAPVKDLRKEVDQLLATIRELERLEVTPEACSTVIRPHLERKLPVSWRERWVRRRREKTDLGLRDLCTFIETEMDVKEEAAKDTRPASKQHDDAPTARATTSMLPITSGQQPDQQRRQQGTRWKCAARGCKRMHPLRYCAVFRRMSIPDRTETVRKSGLCSRCFGPHQERDCKTRFRCNECSDLHHTMLHPTTNESGPPPPPPNQSAPPPSSQSNRASSGQGQAPPTWIPTHNRHAVSVRDAQCYSQTALVLVAHPDGGRELPVRLLIDGGADSSYVRRSVAEKLQAPAVEEGVFACVGFQEKVEEARKHTRVLLTVRGRHGQAPLTLSFWTVDKLCAPLPRRPIPNIPVLQQMPLADDFLEGALDILVGNDQLYDVVGHQQVALSPGLRAVETAFGWVVHGKAHSSLLPSGHTLVTHTVHQISRVHVEPALLGSDDAGEKENVPETRMWDLDVLGVEEADNDVDGFRRPFYDESTRRYVAPLLWRSDERPVSNRAAVVARTSRLEATLSADEFQAYDDYMRKLYEDGVIGLAGEKNSEEYLLPHRGVWRNEKLRPVFDAAAPDGMGRSLNEYLHPGHNLLARLLDVLLHFRSDGVATVHDIQAAFHCLCTAEEDRQYLRFRWRNADFVWYRIPFGLCCSPHLLLTSIEEHLRRLEGQYPTVCANLRRGLYMDDGLSTHGSLAEALVFAETAKEIFALAKMSLHKCRTSQDGGEPVRVLGLRWDTNRDTLAVLIPREHPPETKQDLLSVGSKCFDPLGVLSPWLIRGKLLVQKTWKGEEKIDWTDALPDGVREEAVVWWKETSGVEFVEFPRCAALDLRNQVSLHVFADASSTALCTAIYTESPQQPRLSLLVAKSRCAPLKPLSIPRLELLAALLAVKLAETVRKAFDLNKDTTFTFYTDSLDVFHWISSNRPWKPWVQNRLNFIRARTNNATWFHVRGTENPADLGTRGVSLQALTNDLNWWEPSLRQIQEAASRPVSQRQTEEARKEEKVKQPTKQQLTVEKKQELFDITTKSTLRSVLRVTALVRRYVTVLKARVRERRRGGTPPALHSITDAPIPVPIYRDELRAARDFWIREAQAIAFEEEIVALQENKLLPNKSFVRKLHPQLDGSGLLWAVPRNGEDPVLILPPGAHISWLIIDDAHTTLFHQGVSSTITSLKAEYHVRRQEVKRVVDLCLPCRRYRGLPYHAPEGGLPISRTDHHRSFRSCGADHCGPFMLKNGSKSWCLLITCCTTRAVHLELVPSMSAEDNQLALRRFYAIRGTPDLIWSDNHRTFKMLSSLSSVPWEFIPEKSPNFGGFYETMVNLTKRALRITLHNISLTFDQLRTTLYEVAMSINLRPLLVPRGEDRPLTPAHFILGVRSLQSLTPAPSDREGDEDDLSRMWRHQRLVTEHLRRRWMNEYLISLRTWKKERRGAPERSPTPGEIVLVQEDNVKRARWPLARVLQLNYGKDGIARSATVRLGKITTRRPLYRLFALEAHPDDAAKNDAGRATAGAETDARDPRDAETDAVDQRDDADAGTDAMDPRDAEADAVDPRDYADAETDDANPRDNVDAHDGADVSISEEADAADSRGIDDTHAAADPRRNADVNDKPVVADAFEDGALDRLVQRARREQRPPPSHTRGGRPIRRPARFL